jgi:hypothetical protein
MGSPMSEGANDPRRLLASVQAQQAAPPEKPMRLREPKAPAEPKAEAAPKPARPPKAPKAPKSPRPPRKVRPPSLALWAALQAAAAFVLGIAVWLSWDQIATLAQANADPQIIDAEWTASNSPAFLEAVSEQALRLDTPDEALAYLATTRAIELDPSRPHPWATLAYLETRNAGRVTPRALDALERSMAQCPLCDEALIRWRFNYVLAHWNDMPEPVRRKAFEHADLLRWIGPNAEFLAEMRYKAGLRNIAFDDYRNAVNTPVRGWDLAPADTVASRAE